MTAAGKGRNQKATRMTGVALSPQTRSRHELTARGLRRVDVYVEAADLETIDNLADQRGIPRSVVVKRILADYARNPDPNVLSEEVETRKT